MLALLPELWTIVVEYLDVPDVVALTRVDWQIRTLIVALIQDPAVQHRMHLQLGRRLARLLAQDHRPSAQELYRRHIVPSPLVKPPIPRENHQWQRRVLDWRTRCDQLSRNLNKRPTHQELIERRVLRPGGSHHAATLRKLERQKIADVVQGLYQGPQRPSFETALRRGYVSETDVEINRGVRSLVRTFSHWIDLVSSGLSSKPRIEAPPRAFVHRMKRRFEQPETCSRRALVMQRTGTRFGGVAALRQQFLAVE